MSKSIHVHQSYSKPKMGRFLRNGVHVVLWLIMLVPHSSVSLLLGLVRCLAPV